MHEYNRDGDSYSTSLKDYSLRFAQEDKQKASLLKSEALVFELYSEITSGYSRHRFLKWNYSAGEKNYRFSVWKSCSLS